jgi:subtilisin-like proprotein convertase family protein
MSEFTDQWSVERLLEFESLDTNKDGLLTAFEVANAKSAVGGSYSNEVAEVLPPGRTIISEIEISEDFLIGDLNVQLSITHSSVRYLDAYLTGPGGQRVELFSEVGGSDDHFDQTVFDDQASYPITKARAPFKGTFMPEALVKREPSLSSFNGTPVQGVWQLVIRGTRSERFGMLHRWSLIIKPQEELIGGLVAAPAQDGPIDDPVSSSWPASPGTQESYKRKESRESEAYAEMAYPNVSKRSPQEFVDFENKIKDAVQSGKLTSEEARKKWGEFKSADLKRDAKEDRNGKDKVKGDAKRAKEEMSREDLIERLKAMQGKE